MTDAPAFIFSQISYTRIMKIYKKTSRKDSDGRVVHTCDGTDYVRRKCSDGTFKFRKCSDSAASASKSKTISKSKSKSKLSASKRRAKHSGGAYEKLARQTLSPAVRAFVWDNDPNQIPEIRLISNLKLQVMSALGTNDPDVAMRSTRYKIFHKFLTTRIAETVIRQNSPPDSPMANIEFNGIQFILHNPGMLGTRKVANKYIPPPVEMRLLLWYGEYGSNDYYHFARPKNRGVRKLYEWVGHRGGDRDGAINGIVGIKRNHMEGVIMTKADYEALQDGYENDFEDGDGQLPPGPPGPPGPGDGDESSDDDDDGGDDGRPRTSNFRQAPTGRVIPIMDPVTQRQISLTRGKKTTASTPPGSLQGSLPPNLTSRSRSKSRSGPGTGTGTVSGTKRGSKTETDSLPGSLPRSVNTSRSKTTGDFADMTKLERKSKSKQERLSSYRTPSNAQRVDDDYIPEEIGTSRDRSEARRKARKGSDIQTPGKRPPRVNNVGRG